MNMTAFILLFQLFNPGWDQAGLQFIWPTEASKELTSSFMEFRSTHFHYGIDIKTWNKTGYKVFATEDGYVSRIRVSPTGYGKAVYLTHKDGYVTVYAHLERFASGIEKVVIREHYRRKENILNLSFKPGEIPVKKGELIAFSGQTGIGSPHLHYEIRSAAEDVINPLFALGSHVNDNRAPEIRRLFLTPLDESTTINSSRLTWPVPLEKNFGDETVEPPVITGPFGILADAQDYTTAGTNRLGVFKFEAAVNGTVFYGCQYDSYPIERAKYIHMHRDYESIRMGLGRPVRLYPLADHPVTETVAVDPFDLWRSLPDGPVTFSVTATDFFGNQQVIEIPVIIMKSVPVIAGIVPAPIRGKLPDEKKPELKSGGTGLYFINPGSPWLSASDIDSIEVATHLNRFRIRVSGLNAGYRHFGLRTEINGRFAEALYHETNASGTWVWYEIPIGERACEIRISLFNKSEQIKQVKLHAFWVARPDEMFLELPGGAEIHIRRNSRFENSWLITRELGNVNDPESYELIIGPDTVPFLSSFIVRIPYRGSGNMAIYSARGNGGSYEGGRRTESYIETVLSSAGAYRLFADDSPPEIGLHRKGKKWKPGNGLQFSVVDTGSGIDNSSINVYINDIWCRADFDPELDILTVFSEKVKSSDGYKAEVTAMDRHGNQVRKQFRL